MPATDQEREILKVAKAQAQALQSEYENAGWRAHHNDIAKYCLNRRNMYLSAKDYDPNEGGKINQTINNSSPEESIHTVSSGFMNSVTNPAMPWIQITPADEDLKDYQPVQQWLWRQLRTMYSIINDSNIYLTLPQIYDEATAFATAACRFDFNPRNVVHARQYTIGSFFVANGSDGTVDTVAYRYPRTVKQLVDTFGINNVSKETKRKYEHKPGTMLYDFVKCVNIIQPNDGRDRSFFDWRGMPFRAVTYEENASEEEGPLKVAGHPIFPVAVIRTGVVGEQVYGGYGRGMRMLPEARQLNKEEELQSKAMGKVVDPPVNAPHNLRRIDGRRGGVNRYRGQRSDAVRATYQIDFPYNEMRDTIDRRERKIEDISGASVFKQFSILDQTGNHQMTVPEIQERRAEKASLLGPMLHSTDHDLLRPMVEIIWEYMGIAGRLEEQPAELQEQKLRIEFVNAMSLEQASAITNGMLAYASAIGELDQAFPDQGASDNLDVDFIATELRQGYLVSPNVQRSTDERDARRQERAEAIARQQEAEQAATEAKAARDLGNTPLGGGNALEAATGA